MLNRTIAPPITHAVDMEFKLPAIETWHLQNGVPVYALQAGQEEVVQIEWVFMAGNSWEDKQLVAATTNYLLKNGTSQQTAFQINEHFEYYGSYLNRHCFNETSNITLHSLSKHLPHLLPLVAQLLADSILPQEELDIFVQNSKQSLSVNLQRCDFVANRHIDALLYGPQHPYGRYNEAAHFDALQQPELLAFYNRFYKQGQCAIFVAGKLPDNMFAQLNSTIGALPLQPAVFKAVLNPQVKPLDAQRQHFILNDEQGVQGAIRIARPLGTNRHHPHFAELGVLNTLFGGFFGSRLMSNIREDKGYTYGIHSYLQNHLGPTAWMVSTEAGRDVCKAAITEVYKEMEILQQELVEEDELLLVRNYMLGQLLGDLDGPFQIINRWKTYILNGLDEQYFYNAVHTIKTITPQRLQQLAQEYLRPQEFYELTVV